MVPRRVTPARAFRVARGTLLGITSAVLAVAAHGMAGGGVPNAAITLALTVLVAWAGNGLAAKTRSPWAMFALLGGSQLSLHVLLTYVSHHDEIALTPAMLATHAVATWCTAVLLTRASAALDAIAAAIAGIARIVVWSRPEPTETAALTPSDTVGHLLDVVLRRVCSRRGPPLFS